MVARPAIIRQSDVKRILQGAADAGITMGIVVKNGEALFLPVDRLAAEKEPSALERWKAKRNAGEAGGHT